jgi:hypothetical protein
MVRATAKDCGEKAERAEEEAKDRATAVPFGDDNQKGNNG